MMDGDTSQRLFSLLGYVQLVFTLIVLFVYPVMEVHVYTVSVEVGFNSTDLTPQLHKVAVMYPFPVLLSSMIALAFSTMTFGLKQQGLDSQDYSTEALDQAAVWDFIFWGFCLLVHFLVLCVTISPGDVFQTALSVCLMTYFLHRICSPKSQETNLTQENLSLLGYACGVIVTVQGMPSSAPNTRYYVLFTAVLLDYCVGLGHTWDRQATLETVANSRLFYVFASTLCVAAMYGAWNDSLLGVR